MASKALNEYIRKRYDHWLDYARFHATLAGISDEAIDILNEVMAMLLEKPNDDMEKLLATRHGQYTELDFYVLQMIKLNATSDTSPYRHKYKSLPVDSNVDWRSLNIIDEPDQEEDKAAYIAGRMREIRAIVDKLDLSDKAKRIFVWHFFSGESFRDWPGPERRNELHDVYRRTLMAIREALAGNLLL